jgi:hypothetical protein
MSPNYPRVVLERPIPAYSGVQGAVKPVEIPSPPRLCAVRGLPTHKSQASQLQPLPTLSNPPYDNKKTVQKSNRQHTSFQPRLTIKSKITVPADPISQGRFNNKYSFPVIPNKILAANETFPTVENMKNKRLNPSVDFNL